jgi:hypothetical protein
MLAASSAMLLAAGATAHAQADKKAPTDSAGAKTSREEPKSGEQSEHRALTRAHQTAINAALSIKQYVDQHKDKLDKNAMNRYTEQIGRALDDAQQHRQSLEASVAPDSNAADQYQSVRDHQQSAAEHYRSLVQEAAKTNPDAGDLKDDANDIAEDLRDAEAAHRKTFSGAGATKKDESAPGDSSGTGSEFKGTQPGGGSGESQSKPSNREGEGMPDGKPVK